MKNHTAQVERALDAHLELGKHNDSPKELPGSTAP
jgi:hypothetical protein